MTCRVKICGITNLEDALHACEEGADALGFVFYPPSPRYISPEQANAIVEKLPPFVTPVALFVNASEEQVAQVVSQNSRWLIQFHGDEVESDCVKYDRPYLKALRMKDGVDIKAQAESFPSALAILLDAYKPGVPGGTGESFDWAAIPNQMPKPIVLAGGLSPENVKLAVKATKPYAVDVSGGVELSKGIKNKFKVKEFISGAKSGY